MERAGWKPNDDHHQISPNCPRCGCSNTKFCYYNNYSLTQPRFFCKGCRRYWTKGGSLRNVPVGGGCRKNRRSSKSLRLPTTTTEGQAHHSNRSTNSGSYGGLHVQNSYGTNVIMNNPLGDSTSSSAIHQDGSSIDLALVYANFLNQKPENSNSTGSDDHQLPELPSEFDPAALDFSSMALNKNNGAGSGNNTSINQLMEDHHPNGLLGSLGVGCHSTLSHNLSAENCGANDHMFFGGLDPLIHHHHEKPQDKADRQVELYASSTHEESVFGLPPLPGQEALWSSSMQLQATVPLVGPDADHDPNLLIGSSWSPFDLPCNETFSRT